MADSGPRRRPARPRIWTANLRGARKSAPAVACGRGGDEVPGSRPLDAAVLGRRRLVLIGFGMGLAVTIVGAMVFGPRPIDEPSEILPALPLGRPLSTPVEETTTTARETPSSTIVEALPLDAASAPRVTMPSTADPPTTAATTALPPPPPPTPALPTPRATADPALPRYIDQALPLGVTARIGTCTWRIADGGQLLASGTVTNAPTTNRPWTLTMHFLQARRELARSSVVVPLGAGESKPWTITSALPNPPPDLICSLAAS